MDIHPYEYHRNFGILHGVSEVVHSEQTGKNTKVKH
jgi:hypothetical protein